MVLGTLSLSVSTRRKLISAALAMAIFAVMGGLVTFALRRPIALGVTNGLLIGAAVGLFEEFYFQSPRGRWLRAMHPLRAVLIYMLVVVVLYLASLHLSHAMLGRWADMPIVYRRLPLAIPLFLIFSAFGIWLMRIVHFIGIENLFHLVIGTYHRPVLERKVLAFLDINGSTALAERLGPFGIRALVGKFLFDLSKPITDHGGEIYLYKGDGLVALWNWNEAVRRGKLLPAIDAIFATLRREDAHYQREFGIAPSIRVGIHGGEVVVSEQGDTKRSIGVYGDVINIAARMEDVAKHHHVRCIISGDVAQALSAAAGRLLPIGEEVVRGISVPIPVCEYRPAGESAAAV